MNSTLSVGDVVTYFGKPFRITCLSGTPNMGNPLGVYGVEVGSDDDVLFPFPENMGPRDWWLGTTEEF